MSDNTDKWESGELGQSLEHARVVDEDAESLRKLLGYSLPTVSVCSGSGSAAPGLIFADSDYEVGDGKSGLHEKARNANEPFIPYIRADSLLQLQSELDRLRARNAELEAERDRLRDAIFWALGVGGEFRPREDGEGAYWWRTELRRRAGISPDDLYEYAAQRGGG